MNRPTNLLKEIELFGATNELFYGLEITSSNCNRIIDYIDQLENALDKACKELSSHTVECDLVQCPFNCEYDSCDFDCGNKENWKEWCMKDVD